MSVPLRGIPRKKKKKTRHKKLMGKTARKWNDYEKAKERRERDV